MLYLSGQHALNLICSLETCGDWHTSALQWESLKFLDSDKMFFKGYGIEEHDGVPENPGKIHVANHIRALLDLMELGKFEIAQGMNKDFICNDKYNEEIFDLVSQMKLLPNWEKIDTFMSKEYMMKWVKYKREKDI